MIFLFITDNLTCKLFNFWGIDIFQQGLTYLNEMILFTKNIYILKLHGTHSLLPVLTGYFTL